MGDVTTGLSAPSFADRHHCGLCHGSSLRLVRQIDSFRIVECSECGFLQTGNLLDKDSMQRYYASGYGGLRQRQGQEVNATVNLRLLEITGAICPGMCMLDVGCGYGFLMHVARQRHGIDSVGVELAHSELTFARETLGLDVRSSLEEVHEDNFDLVVLFEVIEHIAEPVSFLQIVTQHARPGGRIAVCTDNFRSPLVASMGDRFPKWIPHQHISLFDKNSIHDLFRRAGGLEVECAISFTPWELDVQRLLHKLTGGRRGGKIFTLAAEMETENSRAYPLFEWRRRLNRQWAALTANRSLDGELMLVVARKSG